MNFNLIMPMAGEGSRFREQGYTVPKPLIDVRGKPMFVRAVESVDLEFDNHIFITRKEHNIADGIRDYYPHAHVVELDALTQGAACSVLTADPYMNSEDAMFVTNCDQFIDWDSSLFTEQMHNDGVIMTFECPERDPKWSYAKLNNKGFVSEVAEKNPISDIATVGIYYWRRGSDYVKYAEQMINNNIRVNNEFYVCPVFNEAIGDNKKIKIYNIDKMWGLGTPEDLKYFIENYE